MNNLNPTPHPLCSFATLQPDVDDEHNDDDDDDHDRKEAADDDDDDKRETMTNIKQTMTMMFF